MSTLSASNGNRKNEYTAWGRRRAFFGVTDSVIDHNSANNCTSIAYRIYERIGAVLTDEQKEKAKELVGEPFEGSCCSRNPRTDLLIQLRPAGLAADRGGVSPLAQRAAGLMPAVGRR
jgi:hypothetical protein